MDLYRKIINNGEFFYPAADHYRKIPSQVNVVCDRCHRNNLRACIGWEQWDMCLKCSDEVSEQLAMPGLGGGYNPGYKPIDGPQKQIIGPGYHPVAREQQLCTTDMEHEMFRGDDDSSELSFMCQGMFDWTPPKQSTTSRVMTNMEQRQFRDPATMTLMAQSQFRPPRESTKMMQGQYRERTRMMQGQYF